VAIARWELPERAKSPELNAPVREGIDSELLSVICGMRPVEVKRILDVNMKCFLRNAKETGEMPGKMGETK